MGSRHDITSGVLIFDEKTHSEDYLAANTGASTASGYTQANPRPGVVTAAENQSMLPRTHNAQDAEVLLKVTKGGYVGRSAVAYSLDSGTNYRGWSPAYSLDRWEPINWTTTGTDLFGVSVIHSTQDIVLVYNTNDNIYFKRRDGTTWGSAVLVAGTHTIEGLDIVATEDESLLIVAAVFNGSKSERNIEVYRSTDNGDTWTLQEEKAQDVDVSSGPERIVCEYYNGQMILLVEDSATFDVTHYASHDKGHSFTQIARYTAHSDKIGISAIQGVGFFMAYRDNATLDIYSMIITNASSTLTDLTTTLVSGTGTSNVTCAVDYNNTIYVFGRSSSSALVWQSNDCGETWSDSRTWFDTGDTSTYPEYGRACCARGSLFFIGNHWASPGTRDDSISMFSITGFTNIEVPVEPVHTWVPMDTPADVTGWSVVGTASTIESDGFLERDTTAANSYATYTGSGVQDHLGARLSVQVDSGGSGGTPDVFAVLTDKTASNSWGLRLNMFTTGFRVVDVNGTAIIEITEDMTEEMEVLMFVNGSGTRDAWVYYKRPWEYDWSVACENETLTGSGSGGAAWEFRFGHVSSTAISRWRYVTLWENIDVTGEYNSQTEACNASIDSYHGINLNNTPYPLPGLSSTDEFGFVSVVGGIAYLGDEYTVTPSYDYPIEMVFPSTSPSPSVKWRSEDTSEQIICFDMSRSSWLGDAIGLCVLGANFKTAYLECYNGASWDLLATLDLGGELEDVAFTRTGSTIQPDSSGVTSGSRYIQENELTGGYVSLDNGDYRAIVSNTAGVWGYSTGSPTVKIRLSGIDGTEDAAGDAVIVWPDGLLIYHPSSEKNARYWRVRIPSQDNLDGYFEAGMIGLGRVIPFGQSHSWGWSQSKQPNYRATKNAYGTERRRKQGPAQRAWSLDWTDGLNIRSLREDTAPDYIGVSGGLPLTTRDDVWMLLEGLVESTEGASIPLVAINSIPSSTGTLTDRTRYIYGYLSSAIQFSNSAGTENENETGIVQKIKIEGVV